MKYCEIIADKLSAAAWSWSYCSAVTKDGWRWILLGERTYFDFCERYPAFAAATRKTRAQAKNHLVSIIRKAATKKPFHAQWLLEGSWPNEYARTERIEQIGEKAEERKGGCHIYYDTGKHTLAELLDFPTMDDPPEVAAEKQRRLLEMTPAKNAPVSA